jgi:hypothetical protein
MVQRNGREICVDCGGFRNETIQRLDRWRWRICCKDCGRIWIKDETPQGTYGEVDTHEGFHGKPYKGINMNKYGLNAKEKAIIEKWS